MDWRTEFPDYPANEMPVIPTGFNDTSWKNDACPSFSNGKLIIWVDYPNEADREVSGFGRYTVSGNGPEFSTDSWGAVLKFIEG